MQSNDIENNDFVIDRANYTNKSVADSKEKI